MPQIYRIDFQIVDGNLMLSQTTPGVVTEVNNLLGSHSQINYSAKAATSYPTPYTHMKLYDITDSKKFTAATKTAFAAAFATYAKNVWQELVAVAVGGYGVYYFVN